MPRIHTEKGTFRFKRLKDGTLSINSILPPSAEPENPSYLESGSGSGRQWVVSIDDFGLDNYNAVVEDFMPAQSARIVIQDLTARLKRFSTVEGNTADVQLSCRIGEKGTFSTKGSLVPKPFETELGISMSDFDLSALQPYIGEELNIILNSGYASASGRLSIEPGDDEESLVSYEGDAHVRNLSALDSINMEDLIKWQSLSAAALDIRYKPTSVSIKGISVSDFYSRIVINSDATLNLAELDKKKDSADNAAGKPAEKEEPSNEQKTDEKMMIKVEALTLQGGRIDFTDRYIKPTYSANLAEVSGKIAGLSSAKNSFADVDLFGKLNDYAPLEVRGQINPLSGDLYILLDVLFKNIELSPLTPYSGKYIGYAVARGKLYLDLQYKILKKKLESDNRIFFDQLNLGEKVESPDAVKLPVKLAIALLKDRKGEIHLDIPISGTTDDPEFNVGKLVFRMILSFLSKAATAPFALLSSLFGGGEDISYVDFEPGEYNLSDAHSVKLDGLIKALYERPGLKLEIAGYVDVEKDGARLRQYFFKQKIKAQKLKDMIKGGQKAVPVDEIDIETDEYKKYLYRAYKKEKFPKPRNIIGFTKKLPVPEMEKLMLSHINIREDDFRELSYNRAPAVKEYMLKSGKIEPERVFLVEPKSVSPEIKADKKNSRVDFKLK
jgi:hypothetical protein